MLINTNIYTHQYIYIYIYIYTLIYIHTYIYIYVCVCLGKVSQALLMCNPITFQLFFSLIRLIIRIYYHSEYQLRNTMVTMTALCMYAVSLITSTPVFSLLISLSHCSSSFCRQPLSTLTSLKDNLSSTQASKHGPCLSECHIFYRNESLSFHPVLCNDFFSSSLLDPDPSAFA